MLLIAVAAFLSGTKEYLDRRPVLQWHAGDSQVAANLHQGLLPLRWTMGPYLPDTLQRAARARAKDDGLNEPIRTLGWEEDRES